ncbi:hypothetical protein [Paractinoplanes atraurantiacus]|uniref:hypothetical protein n=1 Tax=Paractinoplanes atraurantiacus TaxID=1036182 RepID=UPI0015CF2538|nr:hypothetical protein [Actinoplanes atraurantiacus]
MDFVERAAGRATSLREHVTIVLVYTASFLLIAGVVVTGAVVVLIKMMSIGSWPGMTTIAVVIAASGGTVFARRTMKDAAAPRSNATAGVSRSDSDAAGPSPDDVSGS